jgi:hypothetical protein
MFTTRSAFLGSFGCVASTRWLASGFLNAAANARGMQGYALGR